MWPMSGLNQSTTYKAPSGPNEMPTGRKLRSVENNSGSSSFDVKPEPSSMT